MSAVDVLDGEGETGVRDLCPDCGGYGFTYDVGIDGDDERRVRCPMCAGTGQGENAIDTKYQREVERAEYQSDCLEDR